DFAAPNAEVWVQGGRLRLQQVLINLMKNALDAMEGAPEKRIEIAMMPGSEEVRLSVRDCGPGLSDDALEQAFDAFYTTKEAGSGMGLGLSISFNIIEDFGGHLTAANHPEGGGLFAMILRPAEAPGAAPMVAE
ncbi:MAG: ATP-binding protein, partial [Pseudomonadota bacterium]